MVGNRRRWEQKQYEAGNCVLCGKPRTIYKAYCNGCAIKKREYMRKAKGCLPKRIGGAGRPTLNGDELPDV